MLSPHSLSLCTQKLKIYTELLPSAAILLTFKETLKCAYNVEKVIY